MQKRILLVDDEPSLRRSLSLGLNQQGIDVELCENGMNALKKIDLYQKNEVLLDTIVLDVQLPDIDGIKLGKIIKSKYPNASMIYITGYADKLDQTEIEDLKADGLLEKPFDVDALSATINDIVAKQPKPKAKPQTEKKEEVTSTAYMLLKVNEKADFFGLYKKLYFMDNVLYCDATRGDTDIFLLVQSDSMEECRRMFNEDVKVLDGVESAEFLPVGTPVLNDNIKEIINSAGISLSDELPGMNKIKDSSQSVCSYVLAEVEREKLDDIYPVLKLSEEVVYCDFTNGSYNLIMMVHGTQFSQIDKFIENKIVNLSGVLKVKEYPIINIYEM